MFDPTLRLSRSFTLGEMAKSQTALRRGIPNIPNAAQTEALRQLCVNVLQPVRDHFARPVVVSSGFRSARLNRAIGGTQDSQHGRGEAADIEIPGVANGDIAIWIRDNLVFDQLILEAYTAGQPSSGWVHVSYRATLNRKQALTWPGPAVGYLPGLVL